MFYPPFVYVVYDAGIVWRFVGDPAADRPTPLPPSLQTPKRFRTRLGVNIRTDHPPWATAIFFTFFFEKDYGTASPNVHSKEISTNVRFLIG